MKALPVRFDDYQFQSGGRLPVSIDTRIAFEDWERMGREEHKLFVARKMVPPSWAVNFSEQRLLLARYFEMRAGIYSPRIDTPDARMRYAHRRILANVPRKQAALDKLCAEYAELSRSGTKRARQKKLLGVIRTLDSGIIMDRRGPAPIVWLIYCHFRLGYDSVATAAETGIQPTTVRQIVFRLPKLWERMQSGKDKKPKAAEVRRSTARIDSRTRRANMSPEEREAFLKYHREYAKKNREAARARSRRHWAIHSDRLNAARRAKKGDAGAGASAPVWVEPAPALAGPEFPAGVTRVRFSRVFLRGRTEL